MTFNFTFHNVRENLQCWTVLWRNIYTSSGPEHFIILIHGAITMYNFLEASLFLKIELEVLLTVWLEAVLCVELQSIYTSQL